MNIKVVSFCLLLLAVTMQAFAQKEQATKSPKQESANDYTRLGIPSDWTTESMSLPPKFAKSIPLEGIEKIWYAPGWGKRETRDYWTYCFLWEVKETNDLHVNKIQKYLQEYYTGLIKENSDDTKDKAGSNRPVMVNLAPATKDPNDIDCFEGRVSMTDYMTHKPMQLLVHVHVKRQKPNAKKSMIFVEVASAHADKQNWVILDAISRKVR